MGNYQNFKFCICKLKKALSFSIYSNAFIRAVKEN